MFVNVTVVPMQRAHAVSVFMFPEWSSSSLVPEISRIVDGLDDRRIESVSSNRFQLRCVELLLIHRTARIENSVLLHEIRRCPLTVNPRNLGVSKCNALQLFGSGNGKLLSFQDSN